MGSGDCGQWVILPVLHGLCLLLLQYGLPLMGCSPSQIDLMWASSTRSFWSTAQIWVCTIRPILYWCTAPAWVCMSTSFPRPPSPLHAPLHRLWHQRRACSCRDLCSLWSTSGPIHCCTMGFSMAAGRDLLCPVLQCRNLLSHRPLCAAEDLCSVSGEPPALLLWWPWYLQGYFYIFFTCLSQMLWYRAFFPPSKICPHRDTNSIAHWIIIVQQLLLEVAEPISYLE